MYREPAYGGGFRYTCSGYRHKKCTYNHVDGAVTTKFAVQTIKQTLFTPAVESAFQRTLAELNGASPLDEKLEAQLSLLADEQSAATAELDIVERNLTRAKTDALFAVVSKEFERLTKQIAERESQINELKRRRNESHQPKPSLAADAAELFDALLKMSEGCDDYTVAQALFKEVNLRIFCKFSHRNPGDPDDKKTRVAGGTITLGDAPPPVELYKGPTGRRGSGMGTDQYERSPSPVVGDAGTNVKGKEDILANVSRGDRTAIELFSGSFGDWTKSLIAIAQALASWSKEATQKSDTAHSLI